MKRIETMNKTYITPTVRVCKLTLSTMLTSISTNDTPINGDAACAPGFDPEAGDE